MNITKSLSSSNVFKSSNTTPSSSSQRQTHEEHHTRPNSLAPSHSSPTAGHKTLNRFSHDGGKVGVLDKIIQPFANLGNVAGFSRPNQPQLSKEITGSLTVARIDQKAINDCEIFFVDGDAFLQLAKETIELARQSNQTDSRLKRFFAATTITRWRAKRKGNKLFTQYEELIIRSEQCEKNLKLYTEKVVNDSSSLMLQALHLKSRLTACIHYNRETALQIRPYIDDTKEYLKLFVDEKHKIQEMLTFYDEITNIKLSQKDTFVPWALRNASNVQHPLLLSAAMFNRDSIESRLQKLLKTIEIIELIIQRQVPAYQAKKSNLEHCTKSLHVMESILLNINSYRTFMKNTDEETLKNTSSRLTTHSDDSHSHQDVEKLAEEVKKGKDDDDDDDDIDDDDDEEDGFVSNMRIVDNPAFKSSTPSTTTSNSSSSSNTRQKAESPPTSEEHGKEKEKEKEKDKVLPASPQPTNVGNGNGEVKVVRRPMRRQSTLEELISQANKSSKRIDETLVATVHIEPYDHSLCSDCSFVYGMTNDCSMHLAALQHTAQEATLKLQKLLEMRERLKRRAQVLESIDWGGGE